MLKINGSKYPKKIFNLILRTEALIRTHSKKGINGRKSEELSILCQPFSISFGKDINEQISRSSLNVRMNVLQRHLVALQSVQGQLVFGTLYIQAFRTRCRVDAIKCRATS